MTVPMLPGVERSGAAQGSRGWEQEGAHGTPEPSISPEATAYTEQERVDEAELEEPPRALTRQVLATHQQSLLMAVVPG